MLPPDSGTKSLFEKFKDSIKSFISNPYSDEMLNKYMSATIDAMFYELENKEFVETCFKSFYDIFDYLLSVFYPTQNVAHIYDSSYTFSYSKYDEFIKVNIISYILIIF